MTRGKVSDLINDAKEKNAKELKLTRKKLTCVPQDLVDMLRQRQAPQLTHLSFKYNFLTDLPPEFDNFDTLEVLMLGRNQLETFPEYSGLINLEKIYLEYNLFEEFPKSFYKLQNLRELYLNNNKIEKLPNDIRELSNLQVLDLSNNKISSITNSLYGCTALVSLNLSSNCFFALPDGISSLNELTELNIENNDKLEVLPEDLGKLPNLTTFLCKNSPRLNYLPLSTVNSEWLKYSFDQTFILTEEHLSHGALAIVRYLNILQKYGLRFDQKAHWKHDENATACNQCSSPFGFSLRRHHCRLCGEIYCFRCCTGKYSHPKFVLLLSVKICQQCNQELQTPLLSLPTIPDPSPLSPRSQSALYNSLNNTTNSNSQTSVSPTPSSSSSPASLSSSLTSSSPQMKNKVGEEEIRSFIEGLQRFRLTEEEYNQPFFAKKQIANKKLEQIEVTLNNLILSPSPSSSYFIPEVQRVKKELVETLNEMDKDIQSLLVNPPPLPPSPEIVSPLPNGNGSGSLSASKPPPRIFTPAVITSSKSSRTSFFSAERAAAGMNNAKSNSENNDNNHNNNNNNNNSNNNNNNNIGNNYNIVNNEVNHSINDSNIDIKDNKNDDTINIEKVNVNSDVNNHHVSYGVIEDDEDDEEEEEEEDESSSDDTSEDVSSDDDDDEEEEEEEEEEDEDEEEEEEEKSNENENEIKLQNMNVEVDSKVIANELKVNIEDIKVVTLEDKEMISNIVHDDVVSSGGISHSQTHQQQPQPQPQHQHLSDTAIEKVEKQYPVAEVAFDFEASNDREISVPEGEFVNVLQNDHPEWWLVMYKGKYGYIPRNYLVLDD